MIGTILTYELVLLQFDKSSQDPNDHTDSATKALRIFCKL